MRKIYIVLTKPKTFISKVVGFAISCQYPHVGIALDSSLTEIKAFGRKYDFLFYPGGPKTENLNHKFLINAERKILDITVSEKEYYIIRREIKRIFKESKGYDFSGAIRNFLGIKKAPKGDKYFCSSFVAKVLIDAGVIGDDRAYYLYRPEDFLALGIYND